MFNLSYLYTSMSKPNIIMTYSSTKITRFTNYLIFVNLTTLLTIYIGDLSLEFKN